MKEAVIEGWPITEPKFARLAPVMDHPATNLLRELFRAVLAMGQVIIYIDVWSSWFIFSILK